MGLQDREYYRTGPQPQDTGAGRPSVASMGMWRVTTWLIVINVAVFLLDAMLFRGGSVYVYAIVALDGGGFGRAVIPLQQYLQMEAAGTAEGLSAMGPLEAWGFFSFEKAIGDGQLWRWLSFQFLHANLSHIFGNMLGLYFFGSLIEDYLGKRRFLAFYLLCGVTGPVFYLFFAATGLLDTDFTTPMIGASAGVFGVLIAAATVAPRARVMLLFPPIPMQLRTLAWLLLGVAAFTVFTQGRNAGGEAAHIGGAALGWILIRRPQLLAWAERIGPSRRLADNGGAAMRYHGWR